MIERSALDLLYRFKSSSNKGSVTYLLFIQHISGSTSGGRGTSGGVSGEKRQKGEG